MKTNIIIVSLALLVLIISAYFLIIKAYRPEADSPNQLIIDSDPTPINQAETDNSVAPITTPENNLVPPIQEFRERITRKPFGIYITPENSPVQPERFAGYHTGVDVEFTDTNEDIPVFAISTGTVLTTQVVSGYGGVTVLRIEHNNEKIIIIYGHLDPARLPAKGETVMTGEVIGYLGAGNTPQTDYERKHLHFGMHKNDSIDLRGYVATPEELTAWHDPLIFF
jgi:murein DD-endopeptidase MepM/ murein hydrolase activator NlpD